MNVPRWACCLAAIACAAWVAGAEPREAAMAAARDFLAAPNYTWSASSSGGLQETQHFVFSEAVAGQHEKGGYTKAWFLVGPHIPRRDWPAPEPWPGITDDDRHYSSRWAYLTPEGWKAFGQLPAMIDPLDLVSGGPGVRTDVSEIKNGEIGNSAPVTAVDGQIGSWARWFRYSWFGFWRPDQEIAVIADHLASVDEPAPGLYDIELTPQGVELLANSPPPVPFRLLGIPWRIDQARVSVTLNVENGILTAYQVAISGTWSYNGRRERMRCHRTRELTDVGTTAIEVPDRLAEMLGD